MLSAVASRTNDDADNDLTTAVDIMKRRVRIIDIECMHGGNKMRLQIILAFLFLCVLCLVSLPTVFSGEPSCVSPPSGLFAWVPGDGNNCDIVLDACGVGSGGINYIQGKVGRAISFDGIDGEILLSSGKSSPPEITFTEELWVNTTATIQMNPESTAGMVGLSGQNWAIFPSHGGFDGQHAGAGISVGTNGIAIYEHADCYMPPLLVYQSDISGWSHIVLVYENNRPRLYLNGVVVRVGLKSERAYVSSSLMLGGAPGYTHYRGAVDEVNIYSRALSDTEIQSLFNAGSAGKCKNVTSNYSNGGKPQGVRSSSLRLRMI
jgi:hypothetical protein